MKLEENSLKDLVEKSLEYESLFLVAVKVSRHGDSQRVKIILDGDNGITIEQCAEVSRKISQVLDEDEGDQSPFVLEVTSPGVDHPIRMFRQYVKNVGRRVKVILQDRIEIKGILKSVNEKFIEVEKEIKSKNKKEHKSEMVEIPFDKIEKTNILISFK
jgi:ribosome maturation factor RimP